MRKRLIVVLTFLGGLYYFLEFATPKYLPTTVPTKYRFMQVAVGAGGEPAGDDAAAFASTDGAAAASAELGVELDLPALLAGRPTRLQWDKTGKALGHIGLRLEVETAPDDPASMSGWEFRPAFWTDNYTTLESVQDFQRVCSEQGGAALEAGEKTWGYSFPAARRAQLAARELGVDVALPAAMRARYARMFRHEGGRVVFKVRREPDDTQNPPAGWESAQGAWIREFPTKRYFMLGGHHETISELFIVIGVAAIGLGLINLLRVHGTRTVMKRSGWPYSLALLVSMVVMMIAGFADWNFDVARQKAERFEKRALARARARAVADWETQGARTPRPAGSDFKDLSAVDPDKHALMQTMQPAPWLEGVRNFYKEFLMGLGGIYVGLSSAIFSLLALYIAAAAYRAFRIKSGEAALMMLTALIVMLGQIPMGAALCDPLLAKLGFGGGIAVVRRWIMEVINAAAFRGIYFGAAIAGLAMGIRIWLSMETKSFYRERGQE
jgi:hypothetical protein